ncbi:MAG: hypothetical protein ACRDIA_05915 [Actinomycetota bacterium]
MKTSFSTMTGRAFMAGLVIVLAFAAVAWACTLSAYLEAANPQKGSAGAATTVKGGSFNPGEVQIRWNSPDGPLVATASGPSFSTELKVPSWGEAGTHYLVAIQRDASGTIVGKGSTAFEVVGAAPPVVSGSGSGFSAPASAHQSLKAAAPAERAGQAGGRQDSISGDDLWRGFAARRASPGADAGVPTEESRSASPMAIGVALLAVGVLATGALAAAGARARMSRAAGRR